MNKLTNYIIEIVTDILLIGVITLTINLGIEYNKCAKYLPTEAQRIEQAQAQTNWVKTQIELNHNENKSFNN